MKICPKCNGSQFLVRAILDQMWKVDGEGKLIEVTESETIRDEDDNSTWICCKCGYIARGADLEERVYDVSIVLNKIMKVKACNPEMAVDIVCEQLGSNAYPMSYLVQDEKGNTVLEETF